ncbi:MAG: hypothetical protein O0V67_08310 [Methanocorpusculum sp.]|nr:hypothetical protein [Methanocorpusculum sp.]
MRKKLLIVGLLAVVICSIIVPASAETTESSEYVVTPWFGDSPVTRALPIVGTVGNGQSVDYTYHVSPGSTELNIITEWILFPQNNELMMQIVTPSKNLLGPYRDSYDNKIDGRIPLHIESSSLESGTWTITVTGESVIVVQPFTLTINVY